MHFLGINRLNITESRHQQWNFLFSWTSINCNKSMKFQNPTSVIGFWKSLCELKFIYVIFILIYLHLTKLIIKKNKDYSGYAEDVNERTKPHYNSARHKLRSTTERKIICLFRLHEK
jgi:hypothetical protein